MHFYQGSHKYKYKKYKYFGSFLCKVTCSFVQKWKQFQICIFVQSCILLYLREPWFLPENIHHHQKLNRKRVIQFEDDSCFETRNIKIRLEDSISNLKVPVFVQSSYSTEETSIWIHILNVSSLLSFTPQINHSHKINWLAPENTGFFYTLLHSL